MRSMRYIAIVAALLIGSSVDAHAGEPAQVVTHDQKANCKFVKFIKVKGSPDAALKSALDQAGRSGDSFLVLSSTDSGVDGEVLRCKP
ncbi:MAG: hypothetical protein JWQ90_3261 [Hydrocarboniphaga sp.]|uniref:hypothetical protein n=1 Tax=Hydrocarboniphaga sp. TaxID=2033016 RepID=UPI00260927C1|nr:hypothetical protein [Hydrocarboniphaga sp.]MDB5970811.1 hypothetical protein [Hydrocarboniphaga sp.]